MFVHKSEAWIGGTLPSDMAPELLVDQRRMKPVGRLVDEGLVDEGLQTMVWKTEGLLREQ